MDHKTVEEYVLSMPNAKLDYPFGKGVAVYKIFIPKAGPLASHVDGVQGGTEKRTEPYETYGEGVSEATTQGSPSREDSTWGKAQQSATSTGSVSGSAGKQDSTMRGEWKMFALIEEKSDPVRISLKCDPQLAVLLREKYESVMPGYHLNKKYWNTLVLTGQLSWQEVQDLIRHSYELVSKD